MTSSLCISLVEKLRQVEEIGGLVSSTTSVRKSAQYSPPAATQPSSKMRPHGTLPDLSA
jgi:hypothetical protein